MSKKSKSSANKLQVAEALNALDALKKAPLPQNDTKPTTSDYVDDAVQLHNFSDNPSNEEINTGTSTGEKLPSLTKQDITQSIYKAIEVGDKETYNNLQKELSTIKSSSIKWLVGIAVAILAIFVALVSYFHGDLKSDLREIKIQINKNIDKLENETAELRTKLDEVESNQESIKVPK